MANFEALAPLALLVALLAGVVAVALVVHRTDLPASVVFVVLGLVASASGSTILIPVSPDLLLAIVLPGLVFEAAFRTDLAVLRPAAAAVLLLAIPGVVVVAVIVAAVLTIATPLTAGEAFVVGAMVAATDPAAVLSTFRNVPVPARLATTVEMESLVNDGTGIVLFGLAIELLRGGGSVDQSILVFLINVLGSGLIGLALGWIAARVIQRVHDPVIELTITIVLAYGTYLLATILGVSGVIATLVAAGSFGQLAREGLSRRTTESIDLVWELGAFLLTAFVFVLVGGVIAPAALLGSIESVAVGIAAVLVARAVVVYGLLGTSSRVVVRLTGGPDSRSDANETIQRAFRPIPLAWLHVLFWAGLRGAVSVALALSLPSDVPNRPLMQAVTFGIVLFTLLVQGTTSPWVVRRSGVGPAPGPAASS